MLFGEDDSLGSGIFLKGIDHWKRALTIYGHTQLQVHFLFIKMFITIIINFFFTSNLSHDPFSPGLLTTTEVAPSLQWPSMVSHSAKPQVALHASKPVPPG